MTVKAGTRTIGDDVSIDQQTIVWSNASIGEGTTIAQESRIGWGASIGEDVDIGPQVVVRANASVGEGTVIGQQTTIGWNTVIGANVTIGEGCRIGSNVVIGDGVIIPDGTQIRSGSVLPGMVLHVCHNGLLLMIGYYKDELVAIGLGIEEQTHLPPTWIAVSVGCLLFGGALIALLPRDRME